jgi:hypothetical protein
VEPNSLKHHLFFSRVDGSTSLDSRQAVREPKRYPRVVEQWPIRLGTPAIGYVGSTRLAGRRRTKQVAWIQGDEGQWLFADERCCINVARDGAVLPCVPDMHAISVSVDILQRTRLRFCILELISPASQQPLFVNRYLRWTHLQGDDRINDYSPLAVRWLSDDGRCYELRTHHGSMSARLRWHDEHLRVRLYLDAAALHPRWLHQRGQQSMAAPTLEMGHRLAVHFTLCRVECDENPIPILSRFPAGSEAAFCITDHCDYDATDRLRAFAYGDDRRRGWIGRGLRMTKTVFSTERPVKGGLATSVQDHEYARIIQALSEDGSEIAPHSLHESGELDPATFAAVLASCVRRWSPRTWIDHGFLTYNYNMGGADDPRYRLLDRLRAQGFRLLSASHDTPTDPCASLNLLAPPRSPLRSIATAFWRHLRNGRPLVSMRYVRAMTRRRLVGTVGYLIDGALLSASTAIHAWWRGRDRSWREALDMACIVLRRVRHVFHEGPSAFRIPYARRELLDVGAVVYPERGVPLHQAEADEMLAFVTAEVVHTEDVYSEKSVDRLIDERGLHVGHCYLLNRLSYLAGIFEPGAEPPRLSGAWSAFVDALSDRVHQGRVWNPPIYELAEYMRAMQHVIVVADTPCQVIHISNRLSRPIADVTVLLPRSVSPETVRWGDAPPKGWRTWSDWLSVWGDLSSDSSVAVQWDATRSLGVASMTCS